MTLTTSPAGQHPMTAALLSFDHLRPEYANLWEQITRPTGLTKLEETKKQAEAIMASAAKTIFETVQQQTGVPWFVTGIIATRESGSPPNFHAWLHNGDPMFDHLGHPRQTVDVPAHRPPNPACSWADGAVDCYEYESLMHLTDWCPELVAWVLERMNGFGYRTIHHIRSPYLWGATSVQQRGKYVRDAEFDPHVMDEQIGGMALLAMLMQLEPGEVKFI